ncbi:MAG: metallophosphoesterase family protein [Bacteroidaceae bacterium]|nr:metallophosphoesterase family protein [Bacteroidales bacterium]MBQ3188340.1 metallophosphoesterase family protein [Bacteroidaceae bacterium]MBQ3623553.1 metallophosphoesterase family protein [Bacteroidaceae bacterium]
MKRIGILSDTHGFWDDKYLFHFADCDEIWHVGDIGSDIITNKLEEFRPLRAVYGNIDGGIIRQKYSETLRFKIEDCNVLMKHIGGYPGRYDASVRKELYERPPQLFVSGHSHILKVIFDKQLGCLHINPGAAGKQGWQQVRTLVKITIDRDKFKDLEVVELK